MLRKLRYLHVLSIAIWLQLLPACHYASEAGEGVTDYGASKRGIFGTSDERVITQRTKNVHL